jgi:hypothetical protein
MESKSGWTTAEDSKRQLKLPSVLTEPRHMEVKSHAFLTSLLDVGIMTEKTTTSGRTVLLCADKYLAQDRCKWRAFTNPIMKCRAP